MQDIVPSGEDRSIRNIPVSSAHKRSAVTTRPMHELEHAQTKHPRRTFKTVLLWGGGALLAAVIGGLLLSTVFEGTDIVVHPKTQTLSVPLTVSADPNPQNGALGYQTITLSQTATTTLSVSGTEHVAKEASGVVTIYNAYNTASQRLIANTRFEAQNGKIYRIHDSITVPGASKKSDGSLNPGSITATVFADSAGEDYNSTTQTRFTIPGFKKDPRYSKFYAESKGAISGGFVGDQPAIAHDDLVKAQSSLAEQLNNAIVSAAKDAVPQGFMAISDSVAASYSDATQTPTDATHVSLSQTGTATLVVVRINDLASALAKQTVTPYNAEAVGFTDPTKVTLSSGGSAKGATGPITITVVGTPALLWQFDPNTLKQMLLGRDKTSFDGIIKTFAPAITSAEATIRPFWRATFPTNPAKLHVEVAK